MSNLRIEKRMCPCCCGGIKSQLPQIQAEMIEVQQLRGGGGFVYGKLAWQCRRTGIIWQEDDQEIATMISKNDAIRAKLSRMDAIK
jgi:hypothetical protein